MLPDLNWLGDLRGPAYIRRLRGRPGPTDRRKGRSIVLVSERRAPSLDIIQQAVQTALHQHSQLYLLHVLSRGKDETGDGGLRSTFQLGDLLTAAVLRAGGGRLPPSVTVVVHVGRERLLEFVTSTIQPDLVIAEQALLEERSSALPEKIGSLHGCPVLLLPTSESVTPGVPESISLGDTSKRLN